MGKLGVASFNPLLFALPGARQYEDVGLHIGPTASWIAGTGFWDAIHNGYTSSAAEGGCSYLCR